MFCAAAVVPPTVLPVALNYHHAIDAVAHGDYAGRVRADEVARDQVAASGVNVHPVVGVSRNDVSVPAAVPPTVLPVVSAQTPYMRLPRRPSRRRSSRPNCLRTWHRHQPGRSRNRCLAKSRCPRSRYPAPCRRAGEPADQRPARANLNTVLVWSCQAARDIRADVVALDDQAGCLDVAHDPEVTVR